VAAPTTPTTPPTPTTPATGQSRAGWWRNSVTYQIYIRSFADGNGDGVGDRPETGSALS